MRRREFIAGLGSATAAAWPLAARAQQAERMRRIGILLNTADGDPETQIRITAFQQAMEQLGWMQGRNVEITYRWSAGDVEKARTAASELLRLRPDVILSNATTATAVFHQATSTIPIVFVVVSEPMAQGFVESLAHPGGNLTGFSFLESSVGAKWLELLKALAPHITRVAVVFNPKTAPSAELFLRSVENVAKGFAVEPIMLPLDGLSPIEPAMTMVGREPGYGLIFAPDPFCHRSSESHRGIGDTEPIASNLFPTPVYERGRLDVLWSRYSRSISTSRLVCRPDFARRKAWRAAGPATD